jgi:hypothetical protein
MKTFEEWFEINPLGGFLSNVQVSNMKTAWDAATREFSKTIKDGMIETDRGVLLSDDAINAIKEI